MSMVPAYCERHGAAKVNGLCPECFPASTGNHDIAMGELTRVFQGFIDADSPAEARTEHFTIDGAAFYRVTPGQWRELMTLAPPDIAALNDEPASVPDWPPESLTAKLAGPCGCSCHSVTMSGICGTCCSGEEPDDADWPVRPLATGLTGDDAVLRLQALGYGEEEANWAVAQAMTRAIWPLRDHWVRHHGGDVFSVGLIIPVTQAELDRREERSIDAWATRVAGPLAHMDGHQLSDEQIRKHGTDRYPSPAAQYAKVLDEAGELGEALMNWASSSGDPADFTWVRSEYADVGLALFALGRKLGLDLTAEMRRVVSDDDRDFRPPDQVERTGPGTAGLTSDENGRRLP